MYNPKIYTVESVTNGHPDKVCDQISDAILDACLKQDPFSRVAVESFGGHGLLVVGGELTSSAKVDFEAVARQVYLDIGYKDELQVITNIVQQSPDIAQGVNTGGAGDQGIMYGYATNETPEFLPKGVVLAHKLARAIRSVPELGPDGKTQVTVEDGSVTKVLVSAQHPADWSHEQVIAVVKTKVVAPLVNEGVEILVNPTGKFVQGGFAADTGLTGRKIMVDTYGGLAPHGGGCFSGKDATKVDRSAAYMARFVAKNIVAAGHANKCLVSVAYAIGKAEPLMVHAIDEQGRDLSALANRYDFRPLAIIERLDLRQPVFQQTAAYGHFGRSGITWENVTI